MASHLAAMGFRFPKETFAQELITLFNHCAETSSEEIQVGEKHYLVLYVDRDIEFWIPKGENGEFDPSLFEIHYNTRRWDFVRNPEWIYKEANDSQGGICLWDEDETFPISVSVPNAAQVPDFSEEGEYQAQIACFAEDCEVFVGEEEFGQKYDAVSAMSFFPAGDFAEEAGEADAGRRTTAWVNGIVQEITLKTNSYTHQQYYFIRIQSYGMQFDLLADPASIPDTIAVGNVIAASVWLSGKIRPAIR